MIVVNLNTQTVTREIGNIKFYNGIFYRLRKNYFIPYFTNKALVNYLFSLSKLPPFKMLINDYIIYLKKYQDSITDMILLNGGDKSNFFLASALAGILRFRGDFDERVFEFSKKFLHPINFFEFYADNNTKIQFIHDEENDKYIILINLNYVISELNNKRITFLTLDKLTNYSKKLVSSKKYLGKFALFTVFPFSYPYYTIYLIRDFYNDIRLFKIVTVDSSGNVYDLTDIEKNIQEMNKLSLNNFNRERDIIVPYKNSTLYIKGSFNKFSERLGGLVYDNIDSEFSHKIAKWHINKYGCYFFKFPIINYNLRGKYDKEIRSQRFDFIWDSLNNYTKQ